MGKLRTAIANTIGTCSKHRAIELVFEANDDGKDVDPDVQTLVRKLDLMRRIIDKFPATKKTNVHRKQSKKERILSTTYK